MKIVKFAKRSSLLLAVLLGLAGWVSSALAVVAGPDSFGYTADTTPANLRDISITGSALILEDDEVSGSISIPFNFDFYGDAISEIFVSSNGFIYLANTGDDGCCFGRELPNPDFWDGLVAGFWEDLSPQQGGTIRHQTLGLPPNRKLVVGFYGIYHWDGPPDPNVTFEIILHESTHNIELQYGDAPAKVDGDPTGVGIESLDGSDGLQIALGDDIAFKNEGFLITHPCPFQLAGDLNNDCIVNLLDFAITNLVDFAITSQNWLINCKDTPANPACLPI